MALSPQINCLSLCSGGAGLDIGLSIACEFIGVRAVTVCYVEREAYASANLVARMEDAALDDAPIWDDVKTFDGEPWRGKVDCITAGYPCQPFSCAGKRFGTKDDRHLWPDIARIIGEVKPGIVFLENVGAHLRLGFGVVRRDLQRRGYAVSAGLFTAAEVGATQERERLFILACANGQFGCGTEASDGPETRAAIEGRSGEMAGTESGGLRALRESSAASGLIDGSGGTVAGAKCLLESQREGIKPEQQRRTGNGSNASLGWPRGERLQGDSSERAEEGTIRRASGTDIPVFPPSRNDHDTWRRVIAVRHDLAPAIECPICRMVDGMSAGLDTCRTDRLRLTGNGVVPLAGAYAFLSLLALHCPAATDKVNL